MDSTNFQPDHHSHHQQQHYLQQQQQHQEPPYPYAAAYSPLLDDDHHLGYGVSPQPHHRHHHPIISNLLSTNQGSYSSCVNREEVPSGSSGVTNSDATSYSYHSLSSNNNNTNNDDVMASPNFLSNFLGIINQNPSDGNQLGNHQWMNPPVRSINNNFNSLLSSSGGGGGGGGTSAAANALGQLGLTSSSPSSCLLGLNLQPSDFFNSSSCFGGGRQFPGYGDHHHHHALASPAEKLAYGGLSWPSRSRALDSSTKASTGLVNNGVAGTKRPAGDNCSDTSSKSPSGSGSNKKTSLKNSCPPFKVRKEKLGDRIAALHQLVSPFGKTDTASVLTEAIGYIQFLQDQIHTLCMPNVKPLRNKPCNRLMQPISSEDHQQEIKEGLRKRGLCLVPTSWTSFITADQLDASVNLPAHHYY